MRKTAFIIFLSAFTAVVSAQNKDIQFVQSEYIEEYKTDWLNEGKNTASLKLKFRGGCCDMPSLEMMNAEVVNDTMYIDEAVQPHKNHDKTGVCGMVVKIIINTNRYPNYKNLIISYKELETTKTRRKPHTKE